MNTKLSIVVSVFNKAHYLESFLWAIRQLQPGAELVLVDDGSNDGSANICKRHADIFVQTDNAWETKANNAGLRKATGDIVAIVQDDDVPLSSHWLKRMADIMHLRSIDVLSGRGTSVNYYYSDIEEPLSASYMQRAFAGCRIDESISKMPRSSLWKQLLKIIPGDGRNYSRAAEYIDQRDLLALNEIDWRPRPIVYGGYAIRSPFIVTRDALDRLGMFDEQFSPLTYDDIDFSMHAEKCKLRVATTRIPQVSKFMGGSSELYSNNAKKQFFKEAASRNIGKILDIHSDLISQNKRSILAEQIVDIYTPSIC